MAPASITVTVAGCVRINANGADDDTNRDAPASGVHAFEDTAGGTQRCYQSAAGNPDGSVSLIYEENTEVDASGLADTLSATENFRAALFALEPTVDAIQITGALAGAGVIGGSALLQGAVRAEFAGAGALSGNVAFPPGIVQISSSLIGSGSAAHWVSMRGRIESDLIDRSGPAIDIQASRVSGVAPLSVYFDASGTTDATTSRPFHELGYYWDFGVSVTGDWVYPGASPKSLAYGPQAACVIETPGTHTITLLVHNGVTFAEAEFEIEVTDPNTVFAGTDTIYIGNTLPVAGVGDVPATVGGSPPDCVASSDWPTILGLAVAGKRVLLNGAGDIYTGVANATLGMDGSAPCHIGRYGSGAKPIIRTTGTANNSGIINLNSRTAKDLRLVDLDFDGESDVHRNAVAGSSGFTLEQFLMLRCDMHDVGGAILISRGASTPVFPDQIFVVDCTIERIKTTSGAAAAEGYYCSATRQGFLGNYLDDTLDVGGAAEHLVRIAYVDRGVFSHNSISNVHSGKEMFGLRCLDQTVAPDKPTQKVVISRNTIATNTYAGIQPDTEATPTPGVVQDVIIESNYFPRQVGGQVAVRVRASRVSIRNNIVDQSLSSSASTPFNIYGNSAGDPQSDVWLYNNTTYSSGTQNAVALVTLTDDNLTGVVVRNNIYYPPNGTGTPAVVTDSGSGNSYTEDHNLVSKATDPLFVVDPPVDPEDFALDVGSPAINAGISVPVPYDYLIATRTAGAAIDQGAIESAQ